MGHTWARLGSFVPASIELDGCEVDTAQCDLIRGGERHHLTTKELEVLVYLAEHPSRPVSYEELLERVWGHSRLASTQPVYSVIKRLRRKLDGHGEHRHLVTVHGLGYRFEPPPRARSSRAVARRSASPSPSPAPRSLSSFVGRQRELARLEATLATDAPIVSLVGPGGAGKTRVAMELVARAAERGLEVVVADLSDAIGPEDVPRLIAAAVGARAEEDSPDADVLAAVARALRARGAWALLLDNAEHVLDSVARAAAELAPSTRILVTSRERLGVTGEHVVEIGPLPDDEAAQLFAERARAAGAPDADVTLIEPIVSRLDGLPLAIEIAAAHAGVVSLAQLRADLDRQLDHLHATRRGVPSRHATLRSSVEWSWGLLEPEERTVLAQCVVFSGGFGLEAAEAVVVLPGARAQGTVRQRLVRLTERSLLKPQSGLGRDGRLALYECVRELASEHLDDRPAVEARHARWARAVAREAGALDAVPPTSAYAALAPDLENLRAAFRVARAQLPELAAELALAIDLVLSPSRGPGSAGELAEALAVTDGAPAVRLRLALGRSRQHQGAEGLRFLEETRTLAHALGTPLEALEADRLWAAGLSALGEPGAALAPLETAHERAGKLAPGSVTLGRLALDLGETHLMAGHVERAGELCAEAARLLEAGGEPSQAARAACAQSHVFRERGEPESALATLERARRLLEDAGDEVALARLELDRGALLAHLCRTEEAADALAAAIAAHHRLGLVTGELRARDWMVLALLGLGRDADALVQARELQQLALELGRPSYEAERAFGATWLVSLELEAADAAFTRALAILEAGGKAAVRGHVLSVRALGRILAGRLAEAAADLTECVAIHGARGGESARAHSRAELALVEELLAPQATTEAALASAERAAGAPWERRHAIGRRSVLDLVRARRAGRSEAEISALAAHARAQLLEGAAAPTDYFTRCTLLLLDHVARAP